MNNKTITLLIISVLIIIILFLFGNNILPILLIILSLLSIYFTIDSDIITNNIVVEGGKMNDNIKEKNIEELMDIQKGVSTIFKDTDNIIKNNSDFKNSTSNIELVSKDKFIVLKDIEGGEDKNIITNHYSKLIFINNINELNTNKVFRIEKNTNDLIENYKQVKQEYNNLKLEEAKNYVEEIKKQILIENRKTIVKAISSVRNTINYNNNKITILKDALNKKIENIIIVNDNLNLDKIDKLSEENKILMNKNEEIDNELILVKGIEIELKKKIEEMKLENNIIHKDKNEIVEQNKILNDRILDIEKRLSTTELNIIEKNKKLKDCGDRAQEVIYIPVEKSTKTKKKIDFKDDIKTDFDYYLEKNNLIK